MLYGNLIFIKKTGGDGSKYPVTEKNIKIGRSENCVIRIYSPQVAPEHCQLIIENNGQAKLRNLFTPTILNGKPLGQGDVTLCHGDVFKLGERLARWEYLPTSKYFRQLLSPTGRLVAVVNPQRRSAEIPTSMSNPNDQCTSATQVSVSKGTLLGSKRKFSEKFVSESSAVAKQRKTIGLDASLKPKISLGKLLVGRHSIKTRKSLLKTPAVKQRKSVTGIISSRTPKNKVEKYRKSTLPSWKVSVDAQPKEATQNKRSPSKWAVKTPSKQSLKNEVRTPSKSTPIKVKTPKRLKLDSKSGDKTPLNTILESPPKVESVRSTRSFSNSPHMKILSTPNRRSGVQAVELVQSEKKPKSSPGNPVVNMGFRKMSLILKKVDGNQRESILQSNKASEKKGKKKKIPFIETNAQVEVSSSLISNVADGASYSSPKQIWRKSVDSATVKTPRKFNNQSSVKKATIEIAQTPLLIDFSDEGDSVNTKRIFRESVISSRKSLQKSVRKSSSRSLDIFQTPQSILKKVPTPALEKNEEEPSRSAVIPPISTPLGSRRSGSVISSKKVFSSSKEKKVSPRGARRKLSLSISSAERAAKKLKTSSPKKPDKNKRAALLVLGKANRKQLLSQNVKVLLKQKIVKKAIKQSVALPIRKDEKKKTSVKKTGKVLKNKKTAKISSPARTSQTAKELQASKKPIEKSENESESSSANYQKSSERSLLSKSKIFSPVPLAKIATPNTGSVKTTKNSKKEESILSPRSTNETISPFIKLDKSSENYVLSSNRRYSKRLSSKNDIERPDFVELSPTALGLMPKNIAVFKTPKETKRQSSSLVTPRNIAPTGIIKSASTSKIVNRKSLSFLSKGLSVSTTAYTPTISEKTDFDFDSFHTSNITMDVFVSPLNKSPSTPTDELVTDENLEPSVKRRNTPGAKKVARKLLQSPQNDRGSKSSKFSEQTKTLRSSVSESDVQKPVVNSRGRKSPKNDLSNVRGVKKLFDTPKVQRSPKNDLSDVKGVKKLMRTPKVQRSPKNDLSDLRGVKKLMRTPKEQKSPKNDLSDLRGIKKLMRTPKEQKSPKNDLSDLRGVKRLMRTPKEQKSPKNDLSDLRGVKRLMRTPKEQKSPKNNLSDLRGVKRLIRTPREQKIPKNDLSDLRGVKKLMRTPKKQKSPKNELIDLRGVKRLLQSPRNQKSPKNDLTDVCGIKQLLKTPKAQKSPQNNLSDLEGVEELFSSSRKQNFPTGKPPRVNNTSKGPTNDLFDVTGVRELFARHKPISNYNVSLTGVAELFERWSSENDTVLTSRGRSLDVSEIKIERRRRRKVDVEKEEKMATSRALVRKGSAIVETLRVTRSMKADTVADTGDEVSTQSAVRGRKTRAKNVEPVKKITRTRVESKKAIEIPKVESPKSSRKRKPVDTVEASPPKLRRKAAASKESVSKETVSVGSKTRKVAEKEIKSKRKVPGKSKNLAKNGSKNESNPTKIDVKLSSKAQKVQKARSQTQSGNNVSPRKTRSVNAKNTYRKARATAAGS